MKKYIYIYEVIKINQIDHINHFLKKKEEKTRIERKEKNQNFRSHECGQTESSTYCKKGVVKQKVVLIYTKGGETKEKSHSRCKFNT